MAEVRLEAVRKSFGKTAVIPGIDLTVAHGAFCVCLGPSGCGKSTLLRLIAGLEPVTAGRIHIGGRDVTRLPPKARHVAMVFQSYALYPHMTAFENMAFGLRLARRHKDEVSRRVHAAARTLHIEELLERKPSQLSGGQRQRVAIGRAIVREPAVFLLDEPLSNLDADLRLRMRFELAHLHRRLGTTMIYVTHDQVEAMTLADRLVVIDAGRVMQSGPPLELYHHPKNLFVAGFLGSPRMNLLPGRLQEIGPDRVTVVLSGGVRIPVRVAGTRAFEGAPVTLGIRPEHAGLNARGDRGIQGKVARVEHLGDHALVYLEWAEGRPPFVVRTPGSDPPRVGDMLPIRLPTEALHLFDEKGAVFNPPSG
jgi:ABC-type sugar transport system ATPase subunit